MLSIVSLCWKGARLAGWRTSSTFFFFFKNLLYEHGFAIVIFQLQRALQSELLFSTGSPSYLVSCCAQETGFLRGISPGGQTYLLVSPGRWSLRSCGDLPHTEPAFIDPTELLTREIPPSQMKGRRLRGYGDPSWPGRAGSQRLGTQSTRLQVPAGGCCPSPAAGRASPAPVSIISPWIGVQPAASCHIVTI